jgi:hypothetical protein
MHSKRSLFAGSALLLVTLTIAGCDSNGSVNSGGVVTFEGRVTDMSGFAKRSEIDGAVVTASNIESDGSLKSLSGEATTDASGNYKLSVEGAGKLTVLTADKADFHSRVLVADDLDGGGTVRTMPMTTESEAEAAVYLESGTSGSAADVIAPADVAAYVNGRLAGEWKSGGATTAEIEAAIMAEKRTESEYYNQDDDTEIDANKARDEEHGSFLTLEGELNAAADVTARKTAIANFEAAMVKAYSDAGVSWAVQAKARRAGYTALLKFFGGTSAEARFALRQQAEILTSLATAQAIEAAFKAKGASETRLNALAQLRVKLTAALRNASSENDLTEAESEYESGVKTEVMAELEIDATLLAAVESALAPVEATLVASVASAGSAGGVASAYSTFYTTAQASARTSLATSGNADLGAEVLTLLSTQ